MWFKRKMSAEWELLLPKETAEKCKHHFVFKLLPRLWQMCQPNGLLTTRTYLWWLNWLFLLLSEMYSTKMWQKCQQTGLFMTGIYQWWLFLAYRKCVQPKCDKNVNRLEYLWSVVIIPIGLCLFTENVLLNFLFGEQNVKKSYIF